MLPRKHFGGGQQHGLMPGIDCGEHGPQRHDRLAGSDFTLDEAGHRHRPGHVGGDLVTHGALAPGQGEGQGGVEGIKQAAAAVGDHRRAMATGFLAR